MDPDVVEGQEGRYVYLTDNKLYFDQLAATPRSQVPIVKGITSSEVMTIAFVTESSVESSECVKTVTPPAVLSDGSRKRTIVP